MDVGLLLNTYIIPHKTQTLPTYVHRRLEGDEACDLDSLPIVLLPVYIPTCLCAHVHSLQVLSSTSKLPPPSTFLTGAFSQNKST